MSGFRLLVGDCREMLRTLPDESVHCVVTSPPYWGLRDYGVDGQLGLEETPDEYVARMVEVFREVRRVLRSDGTLWLNLGDSYANDGKWGGSTGGKHASDLHGGTGIGRMRRHTGLKPKDLVGIPWRVAFALQADGWYLRSEIVWAKGGSFGPWHGSVMPERVRDRPTSAHDKVFLLAKSEAYYFDADAIAEPAVTAEEAKYDNGLNGHGGGESHAGQGSSTRKFRVGRSGNVERKHGEAADRPGSHLGRSVPREGGTRNVRNVWQIAPKPYPGAHFATFPPALAEKCILAGCPKGGIVLDPFAGSGTTGMVATGHGRNAVLIELNPTYAELARERIGPMLEVCDAA